MRKAWARLPNILRCCGRPAPAAEIWVIPANVIEKAMLFDGRQIGRRKEYFLEFFPVIWRAIDVHLSNG